MNRLNCVVFIGLFAALAGCAKDRSFSPPAENKYVTVTIQVGNELKVEPIRVLYRSAVCKRATYDGNFRRTDVDEYHPFDLLPQRISETDLYEVKLPKDGGGQCKWQLNKVTFDVVYADPKRFGESAVAGGGGGVVVRFYYNSAAASGILVKGDLSIEKNYYPWVYEGFLGGYRKRVNIFGGARLYLQYNAPSAERVFFKPVLHPDLITYSKEPKVKKEGNDPVFTYPDGRVISDGNTEPDLDILEAIRADVGSGK
jgi:hypothetical protein